MKWIYHGKVMAGHFCNAQGTRFQVVVYQGVASDPSPTTGIIQTVGETGVALSTLVGCSPQITICSSLNSFFSPEGDCGLHPYWGLDDARDPINEDHPQCSFSDLDFHHNHCNRWKYDPS